MPATRHGYHRPFITAHTGCEGTPRNSLASIVAGIAAGADAVEVDVRATSDGYPVLVHDETVTGDDGVTRPVEQLTLDELHAVTRDGNDAAGGRSEPVIALADALSLARERNIDINIDLKDDLCIPGVIAEIERLDVSELVVLSGCTRERAATITGRHPEVRVLLNTDEPGAGGHEGDYDSFVAAVCRDAIYAGCCGINIDFRVCRDELVLFARRRFLPVSVWTVNSAEEMVQMMELGVFAITTDNPGQLSAMFS